MRDQRSTATHRSAGRLLRWVLVVTVGEAIGFLVPAVVGAAVTAAAGAVATLIAMVLAGSVEGAVLGAAQSDCLHRWGGCRSDAGGSPYWPRCGCRMVSWNAAGHGGRSELDDRNGRNRWNR